MSERVEHDGDLTPSVGIFHSLLLAASIWLAMDFIWWLL